MIPVRNMRNEAQCFAKAEELEALARRWDSAGQGGDLLHMARCWRVVAAQAAWQDASEPHP